MNITSTPVIAAPWQAAVVDVTNTGAATIYYGSDHNVTAATGTPIAPAAHVELTSTPVYLVAPAGDSTATVAVATNAPEVRAKVAAESGVPASILPLGPLASVRAAAAALNAWKASA